MKILSLLPGKRATPNKTAVPLGEERVSCVLTHPFWTGKAEMKPVLFTIGLPLTVVRSAVLLALKKVWEMVLKGPEGGVVCDRGIARRAVSRGLRPQGVMETHAMPELAPELATHAWESFEEIETETGKSPRVGAGCPIKVSWVGSRGLMENIDRVLEPGLTARRTCGMLVGIGG
jgi:hypothetical protein